jgi:hypothetical protein
VEETDMSKQAHVTVETVMGYLKETSDGITSYYDDPFYAGDKKLMNYSDWAASVQTTETEEELDIHSMAFLRQT